MVRRAFTLVELFVAVAILGLLAAILFPVVATGQAKATPEGNLRQIGRAALEYAEENDGTIVGAEDRHDSAHPWPVRLLPYVKDRATFFDPVRFVPKGEIVQLKAEAVLPWYQVVDLSINEEGYSGYRTALRGACTGRRVGPMRERSLHEMAEPGRRVAFAPTTWGGTGLGWFMFRASQASLTRPDAENATLDWNNMVWNTRGLYGGTIPVVHADGSLGRLQGKNFAHLPEVNDKAAYWCLDGARGQADVGTVLERRVA